MVNQFEALLQELLFLSNDAQGIHFFSKQVDENTQIQIAGSEALL